VRASLPQTPQACTFIRTCPRPGSGISRSTIWNSPPGLGTCATFIPGGYSPGHTHPKFAFIYAFVLEGAIRSQVNEGPVTTYKAGQSFSELPGDRHDVGANASKTKPAKLLAVFVVDTNETELTIPFGTGY
jgi:hypothetical protein